MFGALAVGSRVGPMEGGQLPPSGMSPPPS